MWASGQFPGEGEADNANTGRDRARVARTIPAHRCERRCPQRLPTDALIHLKLGFGLSDDVPVQQGHGPIVPTRRSVRGRTTDGPPRTKKAVSKGCRDMDRHWQAIQWNVP